MPIFEIDQSLCTQCLGCFSACPVNAIELTKNGLVIRGDRCISCGYCMKSCSHSAVVCTRQLEQVKKFIRIGRKVILSIDPACMAFLPQNVGLEKLAAAVQQLGFWDAADAGEAATAVAREYARQALEGQRKNLIFSACPVVQNLMEQYYPELLTDLLPVASPMIVHGRMLKHGFTSAAVVHVTTCAAKIAEAQDVRHSTEINAVLTIGELLRWLEQEGIDLEKCAEEPLLSDVSGWGELYAIPGGMMECCAHFMSESAYHPLTVDGLECCKQLLAELKSEKLTGCLIEMNACQGGCVNCSCEQDAPQHNPFGATLKLREYVVSQEQGIASDVPDIALGNPAIDFSVGTYEPSEEEIQQMLCRIGVGNQNHRKDCGKCSYSTCIQRAEAILKKHEPASLCPQMVHDTIVDVYGLLYEQLPVAAMLIDETQRVVDYNREAASLFALQKRQEKYIFEIMDPVDVQYVLNTGLSIRGKRLDIPELFLRIEEILVPLPSLSMVLGLFLDVTQEENQEEAIQQSRIQSVEMAQRVIDKQMAVAQQIAFLLGETTADTKVTLNQLKKRIMGEGEEQ